MPSLELIPKQRYRRATWKNGLGYTDQIAIFPEDADLRRGDFLWRLSSARIEQASPFSAFPEHDRTLVVLKGRGLRLTHTFEEGGEEETHELPPLEPYEFPGDVPSRCELVSGAVTDLSVFVRKAEAEAVTEVAELEEGEAFPWVPAGRWNFAFAAQGSFEVRSSVAAGPLRLGEGDTLRVQLEGPVAEDDPVELHCAGGPGRLVLVSLQG